MNRDHQQQGFSYVEVLVATVLIGVSLVPALEALDTGLRGAGEHSDAVSRRAHLVEVFEATLAEPYATLVAAAGGNAVASSYSETPGSVDRVLIYIAPYDLDNADSDDDPFSGGDDGILWLRAHVEGSDDELVTLTRR